MIDQTTRISTTRSQTRPSRTPLVAAAMLGLALLFAVGFVQGQGDVVHNAAHDTRHSFAFPCH